MLTTRRKVCAIPSTGRRALSAPALFSGSISRLDDRPTAKVHTAKTPVWNPVPLSSVGSEFVMTSEERLPFALPQARSPALPKPRPRGS